MLLFHRFLSSIKKKQANIQTAETFLTRTKRNFLKRRKTNCKTKTKNEYAEEDRHKSY